MPCSSAYSIGSEQSVPPNGRFETAFTASVRRCRGEMESCRNDVVAGLAEIDVVVWVHLLRLRIAAGVRGKVSNDFVCIHVGRRAGTGLKNVNWKVLVVLAVGNFRSGNGDLCGDRLVDQPELGVRLRGSQFDQA